MTILSVSRINPWYNNCVPLLHESLLAMLMSVNQHSCISRNAALNLLWLSISPACASVCRPMMHPWRPPLAVASECVSVQPQAAAGVSPELLLLPWMALAVLLLLGWPWPPAAASKVGNAKLCMHKSCRVVAVVWSGHRADELYLELCCCWYLASSSVAMKLTFRF